MAKAIETTNIAEQASEGQSLRVFFALWPDPELRSRLHSWARKCQRECRGRAMSRETLHMTLLFLGQVPKADVVRLLQAAERVNCLPFSFRLTRLSGWSHNRIVYAAPEGEIEPLIELSRTLRQVADEAGIPFDRRGFTPHVTLLRKAEQPVRPRPLELPAWQVTGFSLVESLSGDGAVRYRDLGAWRCGR